MNKKMDVAHTGVPVLIEPTQAKAG